MELMLIIKVLLRRWWLILIPLVIVGVWVMPDMLERGPIGTGSYTTMFRYTAGQNLEAIPNREGDFQDVWLASELVVNAFTDWVRTTRFIDDVIDVAGIEINTAALSISADNERSIGQVFLTYPVESDLVVIADAVIEVLQTRNQAYFGAQLGDVPAQVTILDTPRITYSPPPLSDRFGSLVRLALGLIAGVGLAFLMEYLDPTIREHEEVTAIGLRVIGQIPR
ncbi:MAG: hypothetical protein Kow00117_19400 [Phototrophicales bacterium]